MATAVCVCQCCDVDESLTTADSPQERDVIGTIIVTTLQTNANLSFNLANFTVATTLQFLTQQELGAFVVTWNTTQILCVT